VNALTCLQEEEFDRKSNDHKDEDNDVCDVTVTEIFGQQLLLVVVLSLEDIEVLNSEAALEEHVQH
jgi:hypothetical protein